nr:hypothetical protein [Tanacetum cinerariifolium]
FDYATSLLDAQNAQHDDCNSPLPHQLTHQLHVLLAGGVFAEAGELVPGVVLGNGFEVEAAGARAGGVAFGGLLVEGVELEQHRIGWPKPNYNTAVARLRKAATGLSLFRLSHA